MNIPAEYWKAIVDCNPAYDNIFFYGVQTTGIFCRPSCKSKIPNKTNVRIFKNAYIALEENFRPCKRCKPDNLHWPTEEWVERITEWLDQHYSEPLTLTALADTFHGSPFHLQRLFKRIKGVSPSEYIQQARLQKAIHQLKETKQSIEEISLSVGFSNSSYFITLFKKQLGCTPSSYRKKYHAQKRRFINETEKANH